MGRSVKHDLTGERFGSLVAIESVRMNGRSKWKCICDCGNITYADSHALVSGERISCGCRWGRNKKSSVLADREQVQMSLCWSCIRSAAPPSLQCEWDMSKAKILPEGAKYIEKDSNEPTKVVISCPKYIGMKEGAELLKIARGKNNDRIGKDYAGLGVFKLI